MGIEKSLNGDQIVKSFISALQERISAGKESAGAKPTVDVELKLTIDKTDLQKAEEALDRLKQGGGAGGGGAAPAMDGALGGAAREVENLIRTLDSLKATARGAADAAGGGGGAGGDGGGGGSDPSIPSDEDPEGRGYYRTETALGFLRSPVGALRRMGNDTLLGWLRKTKLAKAFNAKTLGGSVEALGGGATGTAAVAGLGAMAAGAGFYAGWKWNESEFDANTRDSHRLFADMQEGASIGLNKRGLTWEADGRKMKNGDNGLDYYQRAAWASLMGMGVSWAGYRGGDPHFIGEAADIAALRAGVNGGTMASFIGGAYQSGTLSQGAGTDGAKGYLSQIVQLIREGNQHGITGNERLSVLAGQLQAIKEGGGGLVTGAAQAELIEDMRRLSNTGLTSGRDQNASSFLSKMGGLNRPEVMNWARQWASKTPGQLRHYGQKYLGENYAQLASWGDDTVLAALTENPEFMREIKRSVMLPAMRDRGLTGGQIRNFLQLSGADMALVNGFMTPTEGGLHGSSSDTSFQPWSEDWKRRRNLQEADAKEQQLGYRADQDAAAGYLRAANTMDNAANSFKDAVNDLLGRGDYGGRTYGQFMMDTLTLKDLVGWATGKGGTSLK